MFNCAKKDLLKKNYKFKEINTFKSTESEIKEQELHLRPIFKIVNVFYSGSGAPFISGVGIGIPISLILGLYLKDQYGFIPNILFGLAGLALLIGLLFSFIAAFFKKKNYDSTKYLFLKDKLIYDEGFLTLRTNIINYSDILSSYTETNIVQNHYNVGTILLVTAGGSIRLEDIESPNNILNFVQQKIDLSK